MLLIRAYVPKIPAPNAVAAKMGPVEEVVDISMSGVFVTRLNSDRAESFRPNRYILPEVPFTLMGTLRMM